MSHLMLATRHLRWASIHVVSSSRRHLSKAAGELDSIRGLQAAFKDTSSPFYLPPGTTGPETPDPPVEAVLGSQLYDDALKEGKKKLVERGYDPDSFWEQPVVWGELDSMRHLNNVHYVRYFESGRMKWLSSIANELGGPDRVRAMLGGQGISFILKSISVQYRRPVTYPDTLLIAHKPHIPNAGTDKTKWPKSYFHIAGTAWSCTQRAFVADSDCVVVWYDYDTLKKCDPGEINREAIWRRMSGQTQLEHGSCV